MPRQWSIGKSPLGTGSSRCFFSLCNTWYFDMMPRQWSTGKSQLGSGLSRCFFEPSRYLIFWYDAKTVNYWEISIRNWIIKMLFWAFAIPDDAVQALKWFFIFFFRTPCGLHQWAASPTSAARPPFQVSKSNLPLRSSTVRRGIFFYF